eukprot:6459537-Amphidinium_carterae.1
MAALLPDLSNNPECRHCCRRHCCRVLLLHALALSDSRCAASRLDLFLILDAALRPPMHVVL